MHLEVISPEKCLYKGDVVLVQLPGKMGSFEILNNHAPIIALLDSGTMKIIDSERNKVTLKIGSGVVEVFDNNILVLSDS
ncbi:MAG: ATP synthase F1 subunit epsilon [Bacteroidetes bacterium]|nr:ATP synthase F1 subunit epsilon [Bacteroidota bacterium]